MPQGKQTWYSLITKSAHIISTDINKKFNSKFQVGPKRGDLCLRKMGENKRVEWIEIEGI